MAEHLIKLILDILSILAIVMCIILYSFTALEVKRLKKQRDFIVHCHLSLVKQMAIEQEKFELAESATKLLNSFDENMDGVEMTLFKMSKEVNTENKN